MRKIFIYYNSKCNNKLKKIKKKNWQNSKSWFVYFTKMENHHSGNDIKIIHYIQTWPPDVKKLKKSIYNSKCNNELKKIKKKKIDKTQNHDLFISPKRKKTILEMASKSFNISKLDHQMSKSWKNSAPHELETTSKFDLLKNWVPDCSAQGRISAKSF